MKRLKNVTPPGPSAKAIYESSDSRKEDHDFYTSHRWRKCRQAFLSDAENSLCKACLKNGLYVSATDVDHEPPRKTLNPDDWYNPLYFNPLCKSCHSKKTNKERLGR